MISIIAAAALVLLAGVFLIHKRRRAPVAPAARPENLARLEEALQGAQLTNDSFFRSLELVQKNLEGLLARAESAEQRLRSLMLQPGAEKREQYNAAALLLSEGQEPHRVASMLNLPLPQVEIVSELQRVAAKDKDKRPAPRKRKLEEAAPRETPAPAKTAARREKSAEPILLVDVLKRLSGEQGRQMNGASAQAGPSL
jgi:hypothetical protein